MTLRCSDQLIPSERVEMKRAPGSVKGTRPNSGSTQIHFVGRLHVTGLDSQME